MFVLPINTLLRLTHRHSMLQSGHEAVRRLALSLSFSGVWDFDSMSGRRVILLHQGPLCPRYTQALTISTPEFDA